MATIRRTSRWYDDYGDDPVTRRSSAVTSRGTVTVTHVSRPPRPNTPNWTPPAANVPNPTQSFTIAPVQPAKVTSQDSGIGPFETLYHDLRFEAIPFYNFWEKDEETSTPDAGNMDPSELPRFIKLAWDPAPDLKDPQAFNKRQLENQMPDAHSSFTQLSPFGFGSTAIVGTTVEGVSFMPDSLQPSNFKENALQLSNGYLFSGIVEAVTTVPTGTVIAPPRPTSVLIDEDDYLLNHGYWWGIPFMEVNSALWRRRSTLYGLQTIFYNRTYSKTATTQKQYFFDGQFGLLSVPQSGRLIISSESSNSPSISAYSRVATTSRTYPQPRVLELVEPLGYSTYVSTIFHSVKAKFIHTVFAGAVAPRRVNTITQPHHAESVIAIAPVAGQLATYSAAGVQHYSREISIPSFPAPDSIKPLEYIGYVIEKYEQQNGSYTLVDTFYIPGREYTSYNDSKVKYGVSYRYRIRSVVRWSRPHGTGVLGSDPTVVDPPGASVSSLTPNDVSYFGSEWAKDWAYATLIDTVPPNPPDEITVRPHSPGDVTGRPYIEVTMKLPDNPQMDINKMVIYRKLIDQDGFDITDWEQIQEVDATERQGTRYTIVTQMEHQQDDQTGTKFMSSEQQQTETFVEFAPLNSLFRDYDVGFYGKDNTYRYCYAAMCYTRHGEQSVLSDQLAARLNPDWKKNGEYPIDFISCAGVDKDFDVGQFSTFPERRNRSEVIFRPDPKGGTPGAIMLRGQERVALKPLSSAVYVLRIESLDNGQHFDVVVPITVVNQPEQVAQLPYQTLTNASS